MPKNATSARLIAREVRVALARADLTQNDLAHALGLSPTAVSRRLSGIVDFTVAELMTVARVTGTPFADLIPPTEPVAS